MWSRRTSSTTTSAADRARRSAAASLAVGGLALLLACAPAGERTGEAGLTLEGEAMGTRFVVRVPDAGPADESRLAALVRAELDAVDRSMSTWKDDSEVSRLNAAAALEPFPLSDPVFEVLTAALDMASATGGAFDVTVGPLVDAWGFGPDGVATEAPSPARIEELRALTGSERLVLDPVARTVTKLAPDVHVDLSAIAKGYSADRVAAALEAAGERSSMVEVGGEIVIRGRPEPGRNWRIGIENPRGGIQRLLSLEEQAVASSGDYRNSYELDGVLVGHTIDPRTGRPVTHGTVGATVLAADCMTADALATALMVMGAEEGRAWADRHGVAALFLVDRDGVIEERPSAAFTLRVGPLQ